MNTFEHFSGKAVAALALALLGGGLAGIAGAMVMLRRAARGAAPVDAPDGRRLNTVATPRGGGMGFPAAALLAALLAPLVADTGPELGLTAMLVLLWVIPNALVGFIDDHRKLSWRLKFGVQFLAATLVMILGLRIPSVELGPVTIPDSVLVTGTLTVLWLVWTTNLFNFMDGMDGIAALSAVVFLSGFVGLAARAGRWSLVILALAMGTAALGFLKFNWPPARIFMGDGGSLSLGAALGGLGVALARLESDATLFGASVLGLTPFVWDATFTLVSRTLKGESPVRPHRGHLYQRLVAASWTPARVLSLYGGLAIVCAAAAFSFPALSFERRLPLVGLGVVIAIILVRITTSSEARSK